MRSYLASFSNRDVDAIAAHVTNDFINEHTAGLGSGCVGRDAYLERLPTFLADMVNLDYRVESLVVDGDRVAAFYTMTASWQGTSPITIRGVQHIVMRGAQIQHRTDYWDSAVFLSQADPAAKAALAEFGIN